MQKLFVRLGDVMIREIKMKKYIVLPVLLTLISACHAQTKTIQVSPGMDVKMETTPGTQAGISRVVVETWSGDKSKKKVFNRECRG